MSLQVQFATIGMMLASGLCMGVWFDICRVITRKLRISRMFLPLLDISFWLISTGFVFWVLLQSNQGRVRYFIFLGIAAGIWLYFILLSRSVTALLVIIMKAVVFAYSVFCRLINGLVVTPIRLLYRLLIIFLGFLAVIAMFIYKTVVQLCYLSAMWVIRLLRRSKK